MRGFQLRKPGLLLLLWLLLVLTACGNRSGVPLPTRVVLPTDIVPPPPTPSQFPTITPTFSPSPTLSNAELTATYTITPSATITDTRTPPVTSMNTLIPTFTPPPTIVGNARVKRGDGANLRGGPSTQYDPPIVLLEPGTPLQLLGTSQNGQWLQVRVDASLVGWVYRELVDAQLSDLNLPITWNPTPTALPTRVIAEIIAVGTPYEQRESAPYISDQILQIYRRGQALGNRPGAFSKVGDSITVTQPFLLGYDLGAYNLGDYPDLQSTVAFFNGSFVRVGPSSFGAANATSVMDSIMASDAICQPNESPLACEIRLHKPSIAFIMLGAADVQDTGTYSLFHGSMTRIIEYCISQGVIPVLMTYASSDTFFPGPTEVLNNAIRNLALQYQIPLIDFRAQAQNLPNRGVVADGFHLTDRGDYFIDLRGEQYRWGMTMRNMLTLQMLQSLMRGIPMQ